MSDRQPHAPVAGASATATSATRRSGHSPAVWVLVAANLVPLYGVLALGWEVFPVVVLFWMENVVIGALNALRILIAAPGAAAWFPKLFLGGFFCIHYGLFTAVHGLFVFALFGGEPYRERPDGLWDDLALRRVLAEYTLWPALAALAASHAFSFLYNYLGRGEFRSASPAALMLAPYGRVVVLHVTLLVGGLLIQALRSPLWALVLLIALKTALDLRAHVREHRRAATGAAAA